MSAYSKGIMSIHTRGNEIEYMNILFATYKIFKKYFEFVTLSRI